MKFRLINLDRAPERLERRDRLLRTAGPKYHRVSAVDRRTLPAEAIARHDQAAREPLLAGEIGCFLSHRAARQLRVDSTETHAVVDACQRSEPGARQYLLPVERLGVLPGLARCFPPFPIRKQYVCPADEDTVRGSENPATDRAGAVLRREAEDELLGQQGRNFLADRLHDDLTTDVGRSNRRIQITMVKTGRTAG